MKQHTEGYLEKRLDQALNRIQELQSTEIYNLDLDKRKKENTVTQIKLKIKALDLEIARMKKYVADLGVG